MTKVFFTLQELIKSDTANSYKIDNNPNEEQTQNLWALINDLLNPFRQSWEDWCIINKLGNPAIRVSSGFRSKKLNDKIGGSQTSAHSYGLAADLIPYNGNLKEFRRFTEAFMKGMKFDQCIFEEIDNKGVPKWIHLGLKNSAGHQRCEFLTYKNGRYTKINV